MLHWSVELYNPNLYIQRHHAYRNKHISWEKSMKTSKPTKVSFLLKEFVWKQKELIRFAFKRVGLPSLWILLTITYSYKMLPHGYACICWLSVLIGTCSVNLWTIIQKDVIEELWGSSRRLLWRTPLYGTWWGAVRWKLTEVPEEETVVLFVGRNLSTAFL